MEELAEVIEAGVAVPAWLDLIFLNLEMEVQIMGQEEIAPRVQGFYQSVPEVTNPLDF